MIPRRGLLAGLGALLAAPAIIRTPGLLMPVRPPLWIGVDIATGADRTMYWSGKTLLMVSTGAPSKGRTFDLFAKFVAANGGVVRRQIVDGERSFGGTTITHVWMDEASTEVHPDPSRARDEVTDRSREQQDGGSLQSDTAKSCGGRLPPRLMRYQAALRSDRPKNPTNPPGWPSSYTSPAWRATGTPGEHRSRMGHAGAGWRHNPVTRPFPACSRMATRWPETTKAPSGGAFCGRLHGDLLGFDRG
jgi:hypothetical protein